MAMANRTDGQENIKIGLMLQSARESKKITQQDMAEATDLTKNHISKIERGQSKASILLLLGYCKKLDMTPDEILNFYKGGIDPELLKILSKMDKDQQNKVIQMINLMS